MVKSFELKITSYYGWLRWLRSMLRGKPKLIENYIMCSEIQTFKKINASPKVYHDFKVFFPNSLANFRKPAYVCKYIFLFKYRVSKISKHLLEINNRQNNLNPLWTQLQHNLLPTFFNSIFYYLFDLNKLGVFK